MQSSSSVYLPRLDHLRFVAAALVLGWHAIHFNLQIPNDYVASFWPLSFFTEGHTGVSLFMVLSGFIFQAICRNRSLLYFQFLRNRVLRIAPLFLVWTLLYFFLSDIDPVKLFIGVFALLNRDAVPGVGWTIVVEFQFYVVFPFLLAFSARYGLRYLIGLLLLAILVRVGVWFERDAIRDIAYWTIFGRIDQFLLGMLACEFYCRRPRTLGGNHLGKFYVLLPLLLFWTWLYHRFNALGGWNGHAPNHPLWILLPTFEGLFYGLITASYLALECTLPRWFDKIFAWLGSLSYSFYLNHVFVVGLCYKILVTQGWLASGLGVRISFSTALIFTFCVVLPVLTAVSACTYYLVEYPFLALRKKYFRDPDPKA